MQNVLGSSRVGLCHMELDQVGFLISVDYAVDLLF